jgi:hypothetical protein
LFFFKYLNKHLLLLLRRNKNNQLVILFCFREAIILNCLSSYIYFNKTVNDVSTLILQDTENCHYL